MSASAFGSAESVEMKMWLWGLLLWCHLQGTPRDKSVVGRQYLHGRPKTFSCCSMIWGYIWGYMLSRTKEICCQIMLLLGGFDPA
jgi:hypothetical protein